MVDEGAQLDEALRALSHPIRRQILLSLAERGSIELPHISDTAEMDAEDRASGPFDSANLTEVTHTHLPMMADVGFIEWDPDANRIARGSRWNELKPLIDLLRDHEDIKRQNERLEEFTSIVSHDLRSPLNVLMAAIELAEETGDPEEFERCRRAIERMDQLIDDLLSLARQGEMVADLEWVSLATIANDSWETVEGAQATLEIETEETIRADKNRLRELLENLFSNAIEHGGRDVTVRVADIQSGFYVEDDGPGIPEDERESIFEPGYSTSPEGTGFGLSIVSSIAQAHGWDIHITSSVTGGVRIEFTGVECT